MPEFLRFQATVPKAYAGRPAKYFLKEALHLSHTRIKTIRLRGCLLVNGRACRMIDPLNENDVVVAISPELVSPELNYKKILDAGCTIVHDDPWLLVVNKPAGLLVHPSFQEPRAITSLLTDAPLHPIRRLDLDSSGLCLIGKNPHIHEQMTEREIIKRYRILVHGRLPQPVVTLDNKLARNPMNRMQRVVGDEGQRAISTFQETAYFPSVNVSLIDCTLQTGRTHQVRAHAFWLGLPLLGDWLYGIKEAKKAVETEAPYVSAEGLLRLAATLTPAADRIDTLFSRHALDAYYLAFENPYDGQHLELTVPYPQDFLNFFEHIKSEPPEQPALSSF